MELVNEFVVNKPVEQAWPIITDVERIAPCMPGAQLTEIEGDVYRGHVKIKVGPIQAQFKGQAVFLERDDEQHNAVLKADGRDTGGKGNASARITARLEAIDEASSRCSVHTDLDINGKVAQFGRGVLPDISKKLIDQFASNLNTMIDNDGGPGAAGAAGSETSAAPSEPGAAGDANAAGDPNAGDDPAGEAVADPDGTTDEAPAGGWDAPSGAAAAGAPTVRKIEGAPAEPIDLVGTAGPTMAKRLIPLIGIAITTFFLLRRRRRRHHTSD
jgi:carbon monoxide dehydrogenase subunit G